MGVSEKKTVGINEHQHVAAESRLANVRPARRFRGVDPSNRDVTN